jgi:uncharacterized protein (DUF4415 family)
LEEGLDKDETDWERLRNMRDEDIDLSDIPELDKRFWKNARIVRPDPTQQVTLRVKRSVLDYFKSDGKGYQTRMNQVLESYVRAQQSK